MKSDNREVNQIIRTTSILFAGMLLLFSFITETVIAQTLTGNLALNNSSPYVADWETNSSMAILTVINTKRTMQVNVGVTLSKDGKPVSSVLSGDITQIPGPNEPGMPVSSVYRSDNIARWSNLSFTGNIRESIVRTGRLPEGNYEICISITETDPPKLPAATIHVCANFNVLMMPPAPRLVSPGNSDTLRLTSITFSWTPVTVFKIHYHIKIVELQSNQSPEQAITHNLPIYDKDNNSTTIVYSAFEPQQFVVGKRYAWQVQAFDDYNRTVGLNNGLSDIYTFIQHPFVTNIIHHITHVIGDYDGDGKTDIALFRPSEATWYVRTSSGMDFQPVQYGYANDILVPGDYDGDGKTDIAVFRPTEGKWYVRASSGMDFQPVEYGYANDILVPGDYDGDGKTDIAVFRPSERKWYVRTSSGMDFQSVEYGYANDVLVPGDYDGDGKTDIAVFRPSEGKWYVRTSSGMDFQPVEYGYPNDIPVPGDYDGDGKTDIAVFRPSEGKWYVRTSSGMDFQPVVYGYPNDILVPGDYDGDGKTDIAVFRPSEGKRYVRASSGIDFPSVQYGYANDIQLPYIGQIKKPLECWSYKTRYNEVRQVSSHNSYDATSTDLDISGGYKPKIETQLEYGIRSLEFDLHNTIGQDDNNWDIYHILGDATYESYCHDLKRLLRNLKTWHNLHPDHEVITLWLEIKDDWESRGHDPVDLDHTLRDFLIDDKTGTSLIYRPMDLLESCPNITTLQDAIVSNGWPLLCELKGKFIIVLHGEDKPLRIYLKDVNYYSSGVVGYGSYHDGNKICFVAPEIKTENEIHNWGKYELIHWEPITPGLISYTENFDNQNESKNVVFFNIPTDHTSLANNVYSNHFVSRVYRIDWPDDLQSAISNKVHHIATNHIGQDNISLQYPPENSMLLSEIHGGFLDRVFQFLDENERIFQPFEK